MRYRSSEPVRLADLADELHLSESRTSHAVSEMFGIPFQNLLLQQRINGAKTLLLNTDLTVGEIARRVGMRNEYHFNRSFRRAVGLPPGRFRSESMR
jgi:AraC-like DNA-binding protein